MDRTTALAYLNGRILAAYSARTITALRAALPLRLALPHLEPVLVLNVQKEIRKDALVFRRAGAMRAAGVPPDRAAVRQLFVETQAIDQDFVARVNAFPVRVVIRYGEIEPLRTQRIQCLADAAYGVLGAWVKGRHLRAALQATYSQSELERVIRQVLSLYAQETRALGRSVRLPVLLAPLRELFAQHVLDAMTGIGTQLARDLARNIYRPRQSGRSRL